MADGTSKIGTFAPASIHGFILKVSPHQELPHYQQLGNGGLKEFKGFGGGVSASLHCPLSTLALHSIHGNARNFADCTNPCSPCKLALVSSYAGILRLFQTTVFLYRKKNKKELLGMLFPTSSTALTYLL